MSVLPAVVLIDHHRARFFEPADTAGGLEERGHIEPKDPHGFERHLEHRKEADYQRQRVPEADEYYERVARRLRELGSFVVLGDATGKSSAMQYLLQYLDEKHEDIAARKVAAETVDLSSIVLGDVERIARSHSLGNT
jgi:hypothetical protein